jgi:hypothetical protein
VIVVTRPPSISLWARVENLGDGQISNPGGRNLEERRVPGGRLPVAGRRPETRREGERSEGDVKSHPVIAPTSEVQVA